MGKKLKEKTMETSMEFWRRVDRTAAYHKWQNRELVKEDERREGYVSRICSTCNMIRSAFEMICKTCDNCGLEVA